MVTSASTAAEYLRKKEGDEHKMGQDVNVSNVKQISFLTDI